MTLGEPISSTIFNIMADAVVYHWESLVVEGTGATTGTTAVAMNRASQLDE